MHRYNYLETITKYQKEEDDKIYQILSNFVKSNENKLFLDIIESLIF